ITEGVESPEARASLYSTVHGAGRLFGRKEAKRRFTREQMDRWLQDRGVTLIGADLDESPMAYRRLPEVIAQHAGTVKVLHTLRPFAVAMAGTRELDTWEDQPMSDFFAGAESLSKVGSLMLAILLPAGRRVAIRGRRAERSQAAAAWLNSTAPQAPQFFFSTSLCTVLPISIKRRQTFARNEITLSTSASLGSLSSGSPGFAPDGLGASG